MINETDASFDDEWTVQVKTEDNVGIEGIPVEFSLTTDVGYLSTTQDTTDADGFANVTFSLTPEDLFNLFSSNNEGLTTTITSYVNEDFNDNQTRVYDLVYDDEVPTIPSFSSIDLDIVPDTLIFNDLPSEIDTTESIDYLELEVIAKDSEGIGIGDIPVTFTNLTFEFGTLTNGIVNTDSTGVALNTLGNIDTESFTDQDNSNTIEIQVQVIDDDDNVLESDSETALLIPKSLENIWKVDYIDAVFLQELSLINNVNIVYNDTVFVQVKDQYHTPVQNVPIDFLLMSNPDNVGYIEYERLWTNNLGIVKNIFSLTPADLSTITQPIETTITIDVGNDHQETLIKTYTVNASSNIEYDVSEFHLFPESSSDTTYFALPTDNMNEYTEVMGEIPFIVKNSSGVVMQGVPVQFEIFESGSRSNGALSTALS